MDKKDNIETSQTEERKPGWNWKESKTIFLVLPIILTVLVPLGGLPYICGRLNFHMGLVLFMIYPAIGVFIIYCFVSGIGRLFIGWRKNSKKKKLINTIEIVIPVVFVVLLIAPFFIPVESDLNWPWFKCFVYGFRDRIKSKADIEAIRVWMRTLNKEEYEDFSVRLPRDEWPKSLKVLNPNSLTLLADKNGNPKVRLLWGAAVYHWGVSIGMKDMVVPQSEINQQDEFWLSVEPGVYVWDRG